MLKTILIGCAILVSISLSAACGGSAEGKRAISTLEGLHTILETQKDDCDALGRALGAFVETNKKAIAEAKGSLKVSESQKKTISKYREKVLTALTAAEKKCAQHPDFVSGYAALEKM